MKAQPFKNIAPETLQKIDSILTDIDDTLSLNGQIPAVAYTAMENLQTAGIRVLPVTGRPAGWCDHIARMWPVDGIVGENGAFYFRYDRDNHRMIRRYRQTALERRGNMKTLMELSERILAEVPGTQVSADQAYRETDLAIDFCEDVPPLTLKAAEQIANIFKAAGAEAKISSIHVNGWFGGYDKLAMTHTFFQDIFKQELEHVRDKVLFSGDSPNDCPMFAYFPHSVGVANVCDFAGQLSTEPAWVTEQPGGYGFTEMAERLIKARKRQTA